MYILKAFQDFQFIDAVEQIGDSQFYLNFQMQMHSVQTRVKNKIYSKSINQNQK